MINDNGRAMVVPLTFDSMKMVMDVIVAMGLKINKSASSDYEHFRQMSYLVVRVDHGGIVLTRFDDAQLAREYVSSKPTEYELVSGIAEVFARLTVIATTPQAPGRVGGHKVKYNPGSDHIHVGCTQVDKDVFLRIGEHKGWIPSSKPRASVDKPIPIASDEGISMEGQVVGEVYFEDTLYCTVDNRKVSRGRTFLRSVLDGLSSILIHDAFIAFGDGATSFASGIHDYQIVYYEKDEYDKWERATA